VYPHCCYLMCGEKLHKTTWTEIGMNIQESGDNRDRVSLDHIWIQKMTNVRESAGHQGNGFRDTQRAGDSVASCFWKHLDIEQDFK
jgi:hypothetical protein